MSTKMANDDIAKASSNSSLHASKMANDDISKACSSFQALQIKDPVQNALGQFPLVQKIQGYLGHKDLLNCTLVSKIFCEAAEEVICQKIPVVIKTEEVMTKYLDYLLEGGRMYMRLWLELPSVISYFMDGNEMPERVLQWVQPYVRKVSIYGAYSQEERIIYTRICHTFQNVEIISISLANGDENIPTLDLSDFPEFASNSLYQPVFPALKSVEIMFPRMHSAPTLHLGCPEARDFLGFGSFLAASCSPHYGSIGYDGYVLWCRGTARFTEGCGCPVKYLGLFLVINTPNAITHLQQFVDTHEDQIIYLKWSGEKKSIGEIKTSGTLQVSDFPKLIRLELSPYSSVKMALRRYEDQHGEYFAAFFLRLTDDELDSSIFPAYLDKIKGWSPSLLKMIKTLTFEYWDEDFEEDYPEILAKIKEALPHAELVERDFKEEDYFYY